MGVSVDQNVSVLQRGKIVLIIYVSVGGVKSFSFNRKYAVIRHNGKVEDHLIHLGLTVASDGIDLFLYSVEHGDDFFGSIILRKVVSRSVVKQVA